VKKPWRKKNNKKRKNKKFFFGEKKNPAEKRILIFVSYFTRSPLGLRVANL